MLLNGIKSNQSLYSLEYLVGGRICMSWCPRCKFEYRDGFDICSDCGVKLTKEQPSKVTKIYLPKLVKTTNIVYNIYQIAILLIIPTLIILSICVYLSPELQKVFIPNPAFTVWEELPGYTLSFCFYSYVLLLINYMLFKNLPNLLKKRSKWIIRVFRLYELLNTIVFGYYFYIFYIYDAFNPNAWHLFKIN
jgi:hypothetical protein